MGKILVIVGAAVLGLGIYSLTQPQESEEAKKEREKKESADAENIRLLKAKEKLEADNIAKGLNADGSAKV